MRAMLLFATFLLLVTSCGSAPTSAAEKGGTAVAPSGPAAAVPGGATKEAVFAGGCFWCMEKPFDDLPGVISTTSGYAGGARKNPSYEEVSAGGTGHAEVVRVVYDPSKVTYERLLEVYWKNVDPTVKDRQFCDTGNQYRSAIFWADEEQKAAAERSKASLEKTKPFQGEIHTTLEKLDGFWPAEEYHQDYYQKNPIRYRYYRGRCGRDARLQEIWGADAKH